MCENICLTCEHYVEETDYCDLDQFEGDGKCLHNDKNPLTECIYYTYKDEKGHIYPWQHSLF